MKNDIEKSNEKIKCVIYLITIVLCFFIIGILFKLGWEVYNKGSLYIKFNL